MVSFTSQMLYPWGKSPRYPLDRKLVGTQSRSGRCGVEKISYTSPKSNLQFLDSRSCRVVAVPTELSRPLHIPSLQWRHLSYICAYVCICSCSKVAVTLQLKCLRNFWSVGLSPDFRNNSWFWELVPSSPLCAALFFHIGMEHAVTSDVNSGGESASHDGIAFPAGSLCGRSMRINKINKLHGLGPRVNYTDRATAACRRSDCQLLRIKGATWSAWRIPTAVLSVF
jgi:hypothetical protein